MINDTSKRIVHVVLDERLILRAPMRRVTLEWFAAKDQGKAYFGVFVDDRLKGSTIDDFDHARALFDHATDGELKKDRRAM